MSQLFKINKWWGLWLVSSIAIFLYYFDSLNSDDQKRFLPGETSSGHYQIEDKCNACHGTGFDDKETLQKSCVRCHGLEMKEVNDSHPKNKFTNPRNADRIKILDARYCVTCHVEHKSERTRNMGVSLAEDYCFLCHKDVVKKRPSHKDLDYQSCDDGGCHNYHDNKALYEEYLVKHNDESDFLEKMRLPEKNLNQYFVKIDDKHKKELTESDVEIPTTVTASQKTINQWKVTSHAKTGVNCQECHSENGDWILKPTFRSCDKCHKNEVIGFMKGKHGMRLNEDLPYMKVGDARLKMHPEAKDKVLDCQSCHSDHTFDVERASIDSCLNCHDDGHSNAYKKSKHYSVLLSLKDVENSVVQGASCATCHMPRLTINENGVSRTLVEHNQNNNLRPNEKMVRSVCIKCHGLKFSLESLADDELVKSNFVGLSTVENEGFSMAMEREELKRKGLLKK